MASKRGLIWGMLVRQVLGAQQSGAHLVLAEPVLGHLRKEVAGFGNSHVCREVHSLVGDEFTDPQRKLASLVNAAVPLVSKDHQPIVRLIAKHTPNALGGVPQGIEAEVLLRLDVQVCLQPFEPLLQHFALDVYERDPKHDHCAPIMTIEVNALCNFSTGDTHEDGPSAHVTGCAVVGQGLGSLRHASCLNEHQLILRQFCQNSHVVPCTDHFLHVRVTCEEAQQPVRNHFGQLQ
mmetsp:Transcript_50812/g.90783  ORF Transcript_50812/g.90783 Transcript_50812/m.90783 type:complete len:235 (-) Transcript_50812:1640-2344(-)